jgi:Ca2+-binding RTX toxin-like protein
VTAQHTAGTPRDRLYGDEGNDALYGTEGDDFLHGGIGSDRVFGREGNDTIHAIAETLSTAPLDDSDELFGGPVMTG